MDEKPSPDGSAAEQSAQPRLRFSARSAFISAAFFFGLLLAVPMAWFNYSRNTDSAIEVAGELARQTGDLVALRSLLLVQPLNFLGEHVPLMPGADAKPSGFGHPFMPLMLDFLGDNPQLYSLYFGYDDGDFLQAISLDGHPQVKRGLHAPHGAAFALRRIATENGRRLERWRFLDANRRLLQDSPPSRAVYDPRTRPWYASAMQMDGPLRTHPYVFSSTGALGITLSRRVRGPTPAVFGVDMTLADLSRFLAAEKVGPSGTLFIFDPGGGLLGHPDQERLSTTGKDGKPERITISGLGDDRATALFERFRERGGGFGLSPIRVDGRRMLALVRPLDELGGGQGYLGLVLWPEDFTGALARTRDQSLLFAIALIAIAVPGLALLAGRFSRSMHSLAEEADRIRGLKMDSGLYLRSHIDEVDRLGTAMASMRSALSGFSRYLPRTLVRQFIETGADPVPGGSRREITLLFSDVENFTPLAEHLAPEDLMLAMSEYFEVVGQAILDSGGTIDKFIGDAVMAFWNAPYESSDHVEQACLAALRVARASEELNARREAAGLPLLRTRVGVHTGTAVVGNLGSADRMDYTALGANVNLASRLEGLNKFYATRILASHAVRDRAKQEFLFRSVDVVVPKGTSDPLAVFELVGAMPASRFAEVAAPRAGLGFCSRWERAITLYRTAQWERALVEFTALAQLHPGDKLAAMYCTRTQRLMENKQGRDWKAIKRFAHK
jgi:adenylate cyclase